MDIGDTIAPDSTQLDAVDLLSGPRIFTIASVSAGKTDQPVNLHLAEFDRPWRPGKSMRRVLVKLWGRDASAYIGRRVELFCDPEVKFGNDKVGGIRIARMSHIDKAEVVPLLVSRGKSAMFRVEPLPDNAPASTPSDPTAAKIAALRNEWKTADDDRKKDIEAEVAVLQNEPGSQS